MLQLLLYQLVLLLVPLGLLNVLCAGKKQRKSSANTGRSNVSTKSVQTPGSKSTDDMLNIKTCLDSPSGRKLNLGGEDTNERGTTTEHQSGRISIHGAIHNTDTHTFASAEQIDGDVKIKTIEGGIDLEKAAPGKVSLKSKHEKIDKESDKKEKDKPKEKSTSLKKEMEQQTQEPTAPTAPTQEIVKSKQSLVTPASDN